MAAPNEIRTQGIPQQKLRPLIERVRERIKSHEVVQNMFDEYKVDPSEIDLIPMAFANLDVSARTDHGVLYFSTKLLKDGDFDEDDHYLVHELTHFLQQTTGTQPTKGSEEGKYLDNPDEIEGFQNQTEYLAETRNKGTAEKYVEKVLDHHDLSGNKRETRKEDLMALTRRLRFNDLFKMAAISDVEMAMADQIIDEVTEPDGPLEEKLLALVYQANRATRERKRKGPQRGFMPEQLEEDKPLIEPRAFTLKRGKQEIPVVVNFVESFVPATTVSVEDNEITVHVSMPVPNIRRFRNKHVGQILQGLVTQKKQLAEALASIGSAKHKASTDIALANKWYEELVQSLRKIQAETYGLPAPEMRERWQAAHQKRYDEFMRTHKLPEMEESLSQLREERAGLKTHLFETLKRMRPPKSLTGWERDRFYNELNDAKERTAQAIKDSLQQIKLKERELKSIRKTPEFGGVGRSATMETQMFDQAKARSEFIDDFVEEKIVEYGDEHPDAVKQFGKMVTDSYPDLVTGGGTIYEQMLWAAQGAQQSTPIDQEMFLNTLPGIFSARIDVIASQLARAAQVWMSPKFVMDEIADDLGLPSQRVFASVKDQYYQALRQFIQENPSLGQLPPEEAPPIPEAEGPQPSEESAKRIQEMMRLME